MSKLTNRAQSISVTARTPTVSVSTVTLRAPGPLANFWAAHGFVVIQPTHLSSTTLGLDGPEESLFWRSRAGNTTPIVDGLDDVEASAPALGGRVDSSRIAVAGHSMGGHTAFMLLGTGLTDPEAGAIMDLVGFRTKGGVPLAAPGNGGSDLSTFAAERYAFFLHPSFATMTTPASLVTGDKDVSPHLTVRGADWHADPYHLSPGPKSLLTVFGGEHGLGVVGGRRGRDDGRGPRAGGNRRPTDPGLPADRPHARRPRLARGLRRAVRRPQPAGPGPEHVRPRVAHADREASTPMHQAPMQADRAERAATVNANQEGQKHGHER